MRKLMAAIGIALLIGVGLGLAQETEKAQTRSEIQKQVQTRTEDAAGTLTRTETRTRSRIRFIDENGDGINDLARDHDGDGIPNGQDPDWAAPKDGTGYQEPSQSKAQKGNAAAGVQSGLAKKSGWSKDSFRSGKSGMAGLGTGTGVCDATGPKGKMVRKGRG
jgi:hypothetical protein